jgi:hypothetical protein
MNRLVVTVRMYKRLGQLMIVECVMLCSVSNESMSYGIGVTVCLNDEL